MHIDPIGFVVLTVVGIIVLVKWLDKPKKLEIQETPIPKPTPQNTSYSLDMDKPKVVSIPRTVGLANPIQQPQTVIVQPATVIVKNNDDFATSMAIGMMTDNAALGMLSGGNIAGAMIGQEMAEERKRSEHSAPVETSRPCDTNDWNTSAPPVEEKSSSFLGGIFGGWDDSAKDGSSGSDGWGSSDSSSGSDGWGSSDSSGSSDW